MLVHTTVTWLTRLTRSEYSLDAVLYRLNISRVDSDLDGRAGGLGHHTTAHTGPGVTGTSGIGSSGANTTYSDTTAGNSSFTTTGPNTTAGPHNSNVLNKLDRQ